MDTWTSALLWYFLWATRCAAVDDTPPCLRRPRRPTPAAGTNAFVREKASRTDLIVVRSAAAAERLRSWGVTAPIESTAEARSGFEPDRGDVGLAPGCPARRRSGAGRDRRGRPVPVAGGDPAVQPPLRPIPVAVLVQPLTRPAPAPRRASPTGTRGSPTGIVSERGRPVALICMEELDEAIAGSDPRPHAHADRARIFSSHDLDASKMTVLLREPRWADDVPVPRLGPLDGRRCAPGGGRPRPPAPHVVRGTRGSATSFVACGGRRGPREPPG